MGKYDLNALLENISKAESGGSGEQKQSDFWKPTLEKGESRVEYTIRFLPNPDSEDGFPYVERAAHMITFPNGKFMYEPCRKKTKGEPCPICEHVNDLYNSEDPAKEKIGSKRFSKKRFFQNVLIVKDPRDGGKNEGKVMIYEAGSQINDKCKEFLTNQEIKASERIFFHPTKGTDFKLVIVEKSGFPNYEKSDFVRSSSPIEVDGKELDLDEAEAFIEEKAFKLNEKLMDDKFFKSYDELKALYENQGVPVKKDDKKSSGKEEEVEPTIDDEVDTTIKGDEVKSRNPSEKAEVSQEVEEDLPFEPDAPEDDEDAELAALLAN